MDKYSKQKRSEVMSAIKSKGTKLEKKLKSGLDSRGIKGYKQNCDEIYGHPDFVIKKARIAIFLDSCFWHGCSQHLRMPSIHQDYWESKIKRNRQRDRAVSKELRSKGWRVIRIWEHSLNNPKTLQWWLTRIKNLADLGRLRKNSTGIHPRAEPTP